MSEADGLDNLLNEIGMGRWQVLGLVANILIWSVLSPHTIGTTLLNAPVPFKCLPHYSKETLASIYTNDTIAYESQTIHVLPNETYFDSLCLHAESLDKNETYDNEILSIAGLDKTPDPLNIPLLPSCPLVIYDNSIFQSTITTEWNLVCDESMKRPLFQNTYTIGLIVGGFIGGDIGDRLGRAKAVLLGSVIHAVFTVIVAFTTNFILLLIGRFVVGVTNLMILVTVVTLSLETCPEKFRGPIGMGVGLPYSIGVIVFAGLGVFLRDWRHLYIATSFPALLLVPVAWLLDESPRWLLQAGELDKAVKVMEKAAVINRCNLKSKETVRNVLEEVMKVSFAYYADLDTDAELLKKLFSYVQKEQMQKDKEKKIKEIDDPSWFEKLKTFSSEVFNNLKTPEMRKISIISPIVWFLNEMVYYGTIFNANRFSSSNPFLYVALTGVADGLGILLGVVGCYFGRKLTVAGSQFISGTLLLLVLAIPEAFKWIQWILVMTGFLLCACASQALFVYTPELFPTVIRARGFAFSNLTGYAGTFVAPFIPDVLASYGWWITNTILGSIGFISCSLVMNLPETLSLAMCETIQDVEDRAVEIKKKKKRGEEGINNQNEKEEKKIEDKIAGLSNVKEGIDNPALEKDI